MEENDPFAAITKICQISSSQEQQLEHCVFVLESEDDEPLSPAAQIPVACTAITMVSPPQTPEDNPKDEQNNDSAFQNDHIFATPPEEPFILTSQNQHQHQEQRREGTVDRAQEDQTIEGVRIEKILISYDGDLRKKNLEFIVEAASKERIEIEGNSDSGENNSQDKEVIHCNYMKGLVFKRASPSSNRVIGDSRPKRSKFCDDNSGLVTPEPSLRNGIKRGLERLVKSLDKFKWTPRANVGAQSANCTERLVKSLNVIVAESKSAEGFDKNMDLGSSSRGSLLSETERRGHSRVSVEKLGPELGIGLNHGFRSPQIEQDGEMMIVMNGGDREFNGESSAKRKLEFPTELLQSEGEGGSDTALGFINGELEEREADRLCHTEEVHSARKSKDNLDKFRYVGPSAGINVCDKENGVKEKRVLRMSVRRAKENAGARGVEHHIDLSEMNNADLGITFLDVLKILAEDEHYDPRLEKVSILEAAKIGGMTFP